VGNKSKILDKIFETAESQEQSKVEPYKKAKSPILQFPLKKLNVENKNPNKLL
jgi:hypothetical protein